MWAAGYGKTEADEILLKLGADTTLKDNRGMTALMIAEENFFYGIVKLLQP